MAFFTKENVGKYNATLPAAQVDRWLELANSTRERALQAKRDGKKLDTDPVRMAVQFANAVLAADGAGSWTSHALDPGSGPAGQPPPGGLASPPLHDGVETRDAATFAEFADAAVDAQAGVIRNVLLVGRESRNGWVFDSTWYRDYQRMAEGGRVYLDHGEPGATRSVRDLIGWTQNIRVTDDGARGDLKLLQAHPATAALLEIADSNPRAIGASQHTFSRALPRRDGEPVHLTGIVEYCSTDLVAQPASVKGLFDHSDRPGPGSGSAPSGQPPSPYPSAWTAARAYAELVVATADNVIEDEQERQRIAEEIGKAMDTAWSLIWGAFWDTNLSIRERRVRITEVLDDLEETIQPLNARLGRTEEGADEVQITELTLDQLREQRPDLVEAIQKTKTTGTAPKQETADARAAKAERELLVRRVRDDVLAKADLPAEARSDAFLGSLLRVEGETEDELKAGMEALVKDRRAAWFKDEGAVKGRGADRQPEPGESAAKDAVSAFADAVGRGKKETAA